MFSFFLKLSPLISWAVTYTTLLLSIALKIPTNSSYYALEQDTAKVCFEIGSNTHFGLYQAGLRTTGLKNIWIIGLLLVSEKAWLVMCDCKLRRCNVCAEPTLNVCACSAFWGLQSATTILHIILALMKTISFLLVYITIFSSKMEDFSNSLQKSVCETYQMRVPGGFCAKSADKANSET